MLLGTALYFLSFGIVVPILPRFAFDSLQADKLFVGIVVGIPALSALVARPLAGSFGNVVGLRTLMVGGALIAGLSTLCYGFSEHLVALIGLRLLTGCGEGAFFTGATTLVTELAPKARQGAAISLLSVMVFLGAGLGPILAVSLTQEVGVRRTFAIAGLLGLVAAVCSCFAAPPRTRGVPRTRQPALNRKALGPALTWALSDMGTAAVFAFIPLYVLDVGTPVQAVFAVYAVVILTIRLGGASIPDRLGPARCGIAALVLDATGLLTVSVSGEQLGLLVGIAVFAAGTALLYPALLSLALDAGSPGERSSIVGTFTMSFDVGTLMGAVVLGGFAQAVGLRASFAVAGACALLGLLVLLSLVSRRASDQSH